MNKQDKIKEAWTEYYDDNIDLIDEKGWLKLCKETSKEVMLLSYEFKNDFDSLFRNQLGDVTTYIRPKSLRGIDENNGWIKIEDQLPPDGEEVLFFNEKWICEDFNPFGTRIGFLNNEDYVSAHYWSYQDTYETIAHWICDDSNEFSEEIKNSIDPTHWKLINGKPPIY